jgi:hypothetical protein
MAAVALYIGTEDSGRLTFKTLFCHNGTPFSGFQTEELIMWTIRRSAKSAQKEDSILKMEKHFGSVGIGSSEIIYMHLYPNQWAFSIKIKDSADW